MKQASLSRLVRLVLFALLAFLSGAITSSQGKTGPYKVPKNLRLLEIPMGGPF